MPNQHKELLRSCRHVSGNSSVLSASQVTLNLTVTLVVSRASLPPGAAGFSISWYEPPVPRGASSIPWKSQGTVVLSEGGTCVRGV